MASQQSKNGWCGGAEREKKKRRGEKANDEIRWANMEQISFPGANGLSESFLERSTSDN